MMQNFKFLKYRWERRLFRTAVVLGALLFVYNVFVVPVLFRWGATQQEFYRALPGDSLVADKDFKNTLAVTVKAPASQVWPWIAQMGLQKGGFYSYTWLENIFGCKLRNADRIYPQWQNPQVGYYEKVCRSAADRNMPGWLVAEVEPGKCLVWKGKEGQWMMGVYIDSVDAHTSRLMTRMLYKAPEPLTVSWWLDKVWLEWAHCVMQRGMITGIKRRAEKAL